MSVDEELQILPKEGTGSAQVAIKDPDSSDGLIGPSEALFGAFEIFGCAFSLQVCALCLFLPFKSG